MKKLLVGLLVFSMIVIVSCEKPTDDEVFYDLQKRLTQMNSYSCSASIMIKGNKSPKEYEALHVFQNPDKYIIKYGESKDGNGYTIKFNGNQLWMRHSSINQSLLLKDYKEYSLNENMFIGYFLEFFITNEESSYDTEKIDSREYFVLTTEVPGGNRYRTKQKLWVDKESFIPYKMVTLDKDENISILVKFKDFKYDIEIKESEFNISI